jgi:STE24 endopeptidase
MFALARLTDRLAARDAAGTGTAAVVPAVTLAIAIVVPLVTIASNQLSRLVERRADAFAIDLTDDPGTQITFQRRIAIKNVSDPDPPEIVHLLLGTHPTTMQRIGAAEAFQR